MKILLCANSDYGGGTWFLSQAINRYTNHEARQFRMRQCYLEYPYHLLAPSLGEMRALAKWCDVLHIRESEKFLPPDCWKQKPTVITYCGRGYRKSAKKLIESRRARGWLVTGSTADLSFYYPDKPPLWIPNSREDMIDYPDRKYRRFTLVHAPTFRERKGTEIVIKAVQGLHNVDLELIEQVPYSQCLRRKAPCHLLFDQFANSYGNNAIEAWALGMPVISNDLATKLAHHLEEACGYLPFVRAPEDVDALREVIDRLHKDEAFYAEMVDKGRRFFFTYHHAPMVAKRAIEVYKMALDGSHKTNYPAHPYPKIAKKKAPVVIEERELNILSLSTNDYAGCGYFLSEAVNTVTRHHSRAVRWHTSRLQFPYDILCPSPDELADLWKWADVIHIHDSLGVHHTKPQVKMPPEVQMVGKLPPKPTVITYHGSLYRRHPQYHNRMAREAGWVQTCSTLDLTLNGPYWLPDCRLDLSKYVNRSQEFIVCHAPTKRKIKDTSTVIKAMAGFDGFDLIEGQTWVECIKRKGHANILIDQFQLGYGCNSIEAWAMSQAVVSNASAKILALFDEHIGYVPFVQCTCEPGAIRAAVERLRDDPAHYQQAVKRGHQCWHNFHSPEAVAKQALAYYNQAMLRGPAMLTDLGSEVQNEVQTGKRKHEASLELEVGEVGLTKVEYIGPNAADMAWFGAITGQRYDLGGIHVRGYVDKRDVPGLLAATGKVGQPVFRVVQ